LGTYNNDQDDIPDAEKIKSKLFASVFVEMELTREYAPNP
jgi:hypothetical protein